MATPNPSIPAEDLSKCGICKGTVNAPKALPCLHTFCLICLREWTASKASASYVVCPACKKFVPLPADGVDGLPGNFFVSSLMERSRAVTPTNVACICCEEMGSKLLARCLTCDGFLCNKGIDSHKTLKFLKDHQVIKLDDLRSGKVNLSSVLAKQPTCDKHKGQALWFFCETCGVLVCRDCTVVNHKTPEHAYVELDSAIKEQKNVIKQLVEESNAISQRVHDELQSTRSTRKILEKNVKQATIDIENEEEQAIKHIRKICKVEKDKLDKWVDAAHSKMDTTEESLNSEQAQLKRAQEMADQVLKTGSDYDVASVYQQLKTSLQDVCALKPTVLEEGLDVIAFTADSTIAATIPTLGTLNLGPKKVINGKWLLNKEFGKGEPGKLNNPMGIVVTRSNDIAVANNDPSTPVHVYNASGKFRFSLDKKSWNAVNVAVGKNGHIYVTTEDNRCIIVYSSVNSQYLSEFAAVSPKGIKSTTEETALKGLAINMLDQVLVGEENTKYISMHELGGTHIRSIKVPVCPQYLATTRTNHIVVSARSESNVHVIDTTGEPLVEITAPPGVNDWFPCGICVSLCNEIVIANYLHNNSDIQCFSADGKYLKCIYKGLVSPEGITLTEKDQKILVAEGSEVKILLTK